MYTKRLHPLFFIAFFSLSSIARSQHYDFNVTLQKAYYNILKLQYKEADALLRQQLDVVPDHAVALYLQNFNQILPVFILEDKNAYSKLAQREKHILNLLAKLPATSPYYYFTQAEIKLHWALLKLKFGDYTAAAFNVRSAYKLLEDGLQQYPDFVPMLKSMALLHIIIGSVPGNYTWLTDLAGLHGDMNKGLTQLKNIANGNTIYNTEAKLWLVLCEHYLLGETDHLDWISNLRKADPTNVLFCFLEVSLLIHDGYSEKALAKLQDASLPDNAYALIPSFYYMLGQIYLHKGKYTLAVTALHKYIQQYKGQAYIKDAYFKIFLAYWLSGKDKEAQRYKQLTLDKGNTRNESDKQAQKMAERKSLPDKNIYRLRLLSDGGYLKEALALSEAMDQMAFSSSDKLEFLYRKARLFHKMGDIEHAISAYEQTIEAFTKGSDYFAPNSCLQLGYIYRSLEQKDKSAHYFRKVLDYKHYEYEETIESKAKAGLASLEK